MKSGVCVGHVKSEGKMPNRQLSKQNQKPRKGQRYKIKGLQEIPKGESAENEDPAWGPCISKRTMRCRARRRIEKSSQLGGRTGRSPMEGRGPPAKCC